jgi:predicted nucleic acid-binding protein
VETVMIHLDTNFLIYLLTPDSNEALLAGRLLAEGESFAVSSVVWMEFVTGPILPAVVADAEALIEGRIVSFGRTEAELAASFFNLARRQRSLRADSMIAAAAVAHHSALLTRDEVDFQVFRQGGLKIVPRN